MSKRITDEEQDRIKRFNFDFAHRQDHNPADWHTQHQTYSFRNIPLENTVEAAREKLAALKIVVDTAKDGTEIVAAWLERQQSNGVFWLIVDVGKRLTDEQKLLREGLVHAARTGANIVHHDTLASYLDALVAPIPEDRRAKVRSIIASGFSEADFAIAKGKRPSEVLRAAEGEPTIMPVNTPGTIMFESIESLRARARQSLASAPGRVRREGPAQGSPDEPGSGPRPSPGLRLL